MVSYHLTPSYHYPFILWTDEHRQIKIAGLAVESGATMASQVVGTQIFSVLKACGGIHDEVDTHLRQDHKCYQNEILPYPNCGMQILERYYASLIHRMWYRSWHVICEICIARRTTGHRRMCWILTYFCRRRHTMN